MKSVLIYNEESGRGKIKKDLIYIESFFKKKELVFSTYKIREDEIFDIDCQKLVNDFNVFLIAGGDGTIHSVINALMKIKKELRPKVLFLPYGTANDCATMLGVSKNINKALSLLEDGITKQIDVNKINDEYFIYASALGKFTSTSYKIDRKSLRWFGPIGYFINSIKDLFKKYDMTIKIISNEKEYIKKSFFVIFISGNRVGGFIMNKFSKSQKLDDGLIDIRLFTTNHAFSWFKMVWFYLFQGRHFKNDLHIRTSDIKLEVSSDYIWNVDGEMGPKGTIELSVLKKEIEVFVNKKNQSLFLEEEKNESLT